MTRIYFCLLLVLLNALPSSAQQNQDFSFCSTSDYYQPDLIRDISHDTIKKNKIDPHKSLIKPVYKSLMIPGWGQGANHQYWKIPVLYAGFAVTIYALSFAATRYKDFRTAYIYRTDNDSLTIDKYDYRLVYNGEPKYSQAQLKQSRDYYQRNIEISVMVLAGIYILNILDAYVSSELLKFDISDDLSLQISPPVITGVHGNKLISTGLNINF